MTKCEYIYFKKFLKNPYSVFVKIFKLQQQLIKNKYIYVLFLFKYYFFFI